MISGGTVINLVFFFMSLTFTNNTSDAEGENGVLKVEVKSLLRICTINEKGIAEK